MPNKQLFYFGLRGNNRGGNMVGNSNIGKGRITEGGIEWDIANIGKGRITEGGIEWKMAIYR